MIVGYILWGQDNGSDMFSDSDTLMEVRKCSKCGFRVDYRQMNNLFRIKRKAYHLSFTYDNIAISSLRFKEFCNRNNYRNVLFKERERSPGFYQLLIQDSTIPFSARLIEDYCHACGQYRTVVGPKADTEAFELPLVDGSYQSDLLFGGRMGKHDNPLTPVFIVSPVTKGKLHCEGFRNLIFEPIEK